MTIVFVPSIYYGENVNSNKFLEGPLGDGIGGLPLNLITKTSLVD